MKARDVLLPVAVPNLVPVAFVLGVLGQRAHDEVVGSALVVEALAVSIDAQERLACEEVVAVVVRTDVVGVAGLLVCSEQAAVESKGSVDVIQFGTEPEQGLDAVARARRERVEGAQTAVARRLQGLVHVLVAGVAAGRNDDALGGVDADHAIGALGVHADNAAGLASDEAPHRGEEALFAAVEAQDVLVEVLGDVTLAAGILAISAVTGRPFLVAGTLGHVVLELNLKLALCKDLRVPVDGLAGIEGPLADQRRADLAERVVVHVVDDVHRVDLGLCADLLLRLGTNGAKRGRADVVATCRLLDEDGLEAFLGGSACREVARSACADDADLEVEHFLALGIGDGRCLAEPVRSACVCRCRGAGSLVFGLDLAALIPESRCAACHRSSSEQSAAHCGTGQETPSRNAGVVLMFHVHLLLDMVQQIRRIYVAKGWETIT